MASIDPVPPSMSTSDATDLLQRVLPARDANELLERLAAAISAEALFVRRLQWPQWIGVRCWCDGPIQAQVFDDVDVPTSGRTAGPARIIGGDDQIDLTSFAVLARQIQILDDQLLTAKLTSMAELAAGAGHEVNNPLGSIVGRVSLLLKGETDPERRKTLASIAAQAYRGRDMIGDLMLFARPPAPAPECVPVEPAIQEVLEEFASEQAARSLTVTGHRDSSLSVWADATQFRIVICELLRNALRFAPEKTSIELSAVRGDQLDVLLSITDDGPTLSPTDRQHLFDPFYSGRQAGRGLGFGLPKCWRIVTLHGGSIQHDDASGRNRFSVRWPMQAADA